MVCIPIGILLLLPQIKRIRETKHKSIPHKHCYLHCLQLDNSLGGMWVRWWCSHLQSSHVSHFAFNTSFLFPSTDTILPCTIDGFPNDQGGFVDNIRGYTENKQLIAMQLKGKLFDLITKP